MLYRIGCRVLVKCRVSLIVILETCAVHQPFRLSKSEALTQLYFCFSEHYVHFSSASGAGCNNIVVQPLRHGHLNVNLGFLQIHHRSVYLCLKIVFYFLFFFFENETIDPLVLLQPKNVGCGFIQAIAKNYNKVHIRTI